CQDPPGRFGPVSPLAPGPPGVQRRATWRAEPARRSSLGAWPRPERVASATTLGRAAASAANPVSLGMLSMRISPMTVSEVLALLDAERDERGMKHWEKLGPGTAGMRSYGIGLTRLRKLAKRIGRDHDLAHAL